jgi:hypothetical protein
MRSAAVQPSEKNVDSEQQLQRQLHRARAADLVERVKSAALAAAAQPGVQRLRRVSELRRTQVVDGAAEVRVVEDVEEIASETKVNSLGYWKFTLERDIGLRSF